MQKADAVLDIYEWLTGEPDAVKGASPVRRGAVGKGLRKQHLAGRLPYWLRSNEPRHVVFPFLPATGCCSEESGTARASGRSPWPVVGGFRTC